MKRRWLDDSFKISITLKAIDGLFELAGAALLFITRPETINRLIVSLTQHELVSDPHDWLANHLVRSTAHLASSQFFAVVYLASHGLIKIVLVVALFKRQRWGFLAMMVFLIASVVYQTYRITYTHSIGLVALTVFDLVVAWLVWREYRVTNFGKPV